METVEAPPEWRPFRLFLGGLVCISAVAAAARRTELAVVLLLVAGIGLFLLQRVPRCVQGDAEGIVTRADLHRGARLGLISVAVVLVLFTCFLFAIPHFPGGARPGSYDSGAIAAMRAIASAQRDLKADRRIDRDGDGVGEFGYFRDLVRGSGSLPPRLAPSFARGLQVQLFGTVVQRGGYFFQMFLPGGEGEHLAETGSVRPDADRAEQSWCCYAWPVRPNRTGKRVLFVDQSGTVRWRYCRGVVTASTRNLPAEVRSGAWRELR